MRIKKRNKKRIILVIIMILLFLISIGYSSLTTYLNINGETTIEKQKWNIYFDNVQIKSGSVSGIKTIAEPTIDTTTTSLIWEVSMDTPGEFFEWNVDIVNDGTIDAMIETETNLIVTSELTNEQKKYLEYSIKYVNGEEIEQYDKLAAGETKTITVKLLFKNDETINPEDLPDTAQNGIKLNYFANYIQADDRATEKYTADNILDTTENDSGVGYYIKKGDEYAVVFADRVAQSGKTVEWSSVGNSKCKFPELTEEQKKNDFKKYIISNNTYTDPNFGTKKIIEVVNNNGEDRFMALALNNLATDGDFYDWYAGAYEHMFDWNNENTGTSPSFLSGKTNTTRMISNWNKGENGGYGAQDKCNHTPKHKDLWGQIQPQVENGWFVPSRDEWSAFGYAMIQGYLKEDGRSSAELGLDALYWTSTQTGTSSANYAFFYANHISANLVNASSSVRLATTY